MAGSVVFYRKAFKKTDIYYKVCDVEAKKLVENGKNIIALSFVIDTYDDQGKILQHGASATIGQKASETLSKLRFHKICDTVSSEITNGITLVLLDQKDKKNTVERKLSPEEWVREYNLNPVSTNLQGKFLRFVYEGEGEGCSFVVTGEKSGKTAFADTTDL